MHSTAHLTPTASSETAEVRLDPDLPSGFDARGALRLGFDVPVARIGGFGAGVERFIAALRTPVPVSRLSELARRSGVPAEQIPALLSELEGALVPAVPRARAGRVPPILRSADLALRRVRLIGDGIPAVAIASMLERSGCRVLPQRSPRGPAPVADFIVFLSRFGWPVAGAQRALASGVPHLVLRFSDRSIEISPVVSGSGTPCITCIALHDRDRDPDQSDLAVQLRECVPASETAESSELAAALALRAIADERHRAPGTPPSGRLLLRCRGGRVLDRFESRPARPHPSCDCHSFEAQDLDADRFKGSSRGQRSGPNPLATLTREERLLSARSA